MKLTRLLPLALLCELIALGTRTSAFSLIAALLFGLFFIRHWQSLMPYPRRLGLATLGLFALWLVKAPLDLPAELCRKHGISDATFYNWKAKYGGMTVSEAARLRALEDENRRLKKLLAESMLDVSALKDLLGKN